MQGKSYKAWFPLLVFFNLLAAGSLLRAQELMTQQVRPSTNAFALDTLPVIDGEVLNDPGWDSVTPTGGFSQGSAKRRAAFLTNDRGFHWLFSGSALYRSSRV